MLCSLEESQHLRTPSIKEGSSNSIIVFATKNQKEVVFKITAEPSRKDNGLSVERDVYMFVKNVLSQSTPHFARGLEVGNCNLNSLFESRNTFFSNDFKEQWRLARGAAIDYYLTSEEKHNHQKEFNRRLGRAKLDAETKIKRFYDYLFFLSFNPLTTQVHYVMTEKMKGMSLHDFFIQNNQHILTNPNFDEEVAIQIAQALDAAEQEGFMHNDLHPGNIFIEKRHKQTIPYQDFKLEDCEYFITIFDYDFASYRGGQENTSLSNYYCQAIGACNQYTANYDWFFFLNCFVAKLEKIRKTSLRKVLGGAPGKIDPLIGKIGGYALDGRACLCLEIDELDDNKGCSRCISDDSFLREFMSPRKFITSQLYTNPKMSSVDEPVRVVVSEWDEKKKDFEANLKALRPDELMNPNELLKNLPRDMYEDPLVWLEEQTKLKKKPVSFSMMGKQRQKARKKEAF